MEKSITFTFTPTKDDYVQVSRFGYRKLANFRVMGNFLFLMFITGIYLSLQRTYAITPLIIFFVFVPAIVVVTIFIINPYLIGKQVEKNERLRSETTWKLSADEVAILTEYSETKFDWGTFNGYLEGKDHFLITHADTKQMVQFVPKRAFVTQAYLDQFREYLDSHISVNQPLASKSFLGRYGKTILYIFILLVIIVFVIYNFQKGAMMY